MSLILEALRRSEAERRRGQRPGLFDGELPPAPRGRGLPAWALALGGAALGAALVAAAAAWWLARGGDGPAKLPATQDTGIPTAAVATPPAAPAPTTPAPVLPAAPMPAAAAIPITAAPPAPPAPAQPAPRPAPMPVAETDTGPETASNPAPVDALGPEEDDLTPALAVARGATLPPLRLSMHVYAEDPARRFAILDGVRVREGEALDGGLRVLEIRRDGVRLAWGERVLWVPR